jgi:hypothetical protein
MRRVLKRDRSSASGTSSIEVRLATSLRSALKPSWLSASRVTVVAARGCMRESASTSGSRPRTLSAAATAACGPTTAAVEASNSTMSSVS